MGKPFDNSHVFGRKQGITKRERRIANLVSVNKELAKSPTLGSCPNFFCGLSKDLLKIAEALQKSPRNGNVCPLWAPTLPPGYVWPKSYSTEKMWMYIYIFEVL